jgi:hypothetical protein
MEASSHDELIYREAAAWASFEAAVASVPRERRSEPLLPDDWSVKDALWHVALWWEICAETFEQMAVGAYVEDELGDSDEINARALTASRAMSLEEVETDMVRIRERMLSAWELVPADPAAVETFEGETIDHYDDHRLALESLAAS